MDVYLSPVAKEYLRAWAHLRKAEEMALPEKFDADNPPLRTSAANFMPSAVDVAIYEALADAVLDEEV